MSRGHAGERRFVGVITVLGFWGTLFAMLRWGVPAEIKDVALIFVGIIVREYATIGDWYYGSSAGSAEKTDALIDKENLRK